MTATTYVLKKPAGTALFALATVVVMSLSIAGTAAAQACGGFCPGLQTAYGNLALAGNGRGEESAVGDNVPGGNTGEGHTGRRLFRPVWKTRSQKSNQEL